MPLEAVMICVDNSDFSRNGDYGSTRFESQTDAVNLVCGAKTQQNPENSVGILTTAGDRIDVMITPTTDLGRMVSELAKIKVGGTADILRGIQTAQLALKHRQNKNQKQRIIAFVGSPVTATERELEVLGKSLKKNSVSLDLVSFGEVEENSAKIEKLLGSVNNNENSSHVLEVPVGPKLLSDVLLSSAIVAPEGEAGVPGGAGGGDAGFEFGVNPNEDPDLALALRISMEEERARQQQQGHADGEAVPDAMQGASTIAEPLPAAAHAGVVAMEVPGTTGAASTMPMATDAAVIDALDDDMDEELRQALLLSLQESSPMEDVGRAVAVGAAPAAEVSGASPGEPPRPAVPAPAQKPDANMTKQEANAVDVTDVPVTASAPDPLVTGSNAEATDAAVDAKWFQDPDFVNELLGSLPGVDVNDPRIQNALKEVGGNETEGENNDSASGGTGGSSSAGFGGGSGEGGGELK